MRKTLSIIVALTFAACAAVGPAQTANTPFTAPTYYATSFNLWSINGQSPNTYIFQGRSLCNSQGQNLPFFAFNTNAPVWIADANTANSEVVTPSAIVNTAGSCGATMAPANNHYNFQLRSGTSGLQEGINTLDAQGSVPTLLLLDKNWWTLANNVPGTYATAILAAAKGDMTVLLEDITTAIPTFYVWSGTAYTSTNANSKNTAPTIAAGGGAGSGPTVSNSHQSTAITGIASVLTGTATTTGTLFTETWPTVANGGPQYDGTCVVKSSGANSYTTFTSAMSDTGSGTTFQRILTVTVATTAPVASTQYYFTYTCK
jgi:hypothetical protein